MAASRGGMTCFRSFCPNTIYGRTPRRRSRNSDPATHHVPPLISAARTQSMRPEHTLSAEEGFEDLAAALIHDGEPVSQDDIFIGRESRNA